MAQVELTDGKRVWTPADAVEATNLKARGWVPVKGQAKPEAPKTSK